MLILKKIKAFFCVVSLCLLSQISGSVRDNFYIGLGFSESFNHFELKTENPSTRLSSSKKKNEIKALGNFFLGYGYSFNMLYLAAEIGTSFPKRSTEIKRPGVTLLPFSFLNKITIQDYLTGDILLGARPINCLLIYLRGGGTWAGIKLHQFENNDANTPSFDAKKHKLAWRCGFGAAYELTKHFGLGVDYTFTHYQHLKVFWQDFDIFFSEKTHASYLGINAIFSF